MPWICASYDVPLQFSGLLIRRKMTLSFCNQGCSCRAGVNHNLCWHRKEILEGSSYKLEQANAYVEQSRQQARAYQARRRALKAQILPYVVPMSGGLSMASKTEVVRMIERIDEVLRVLQDLRRSEMEELEEIEAREGLDLAPQCPYRICYPRYKRRIEPREGLDIALHRPEAGREITRQR